MSIRKKPPVPAKMYRHFALATIAMTTVVAVMADSSHHEESEETEALASGTEQEAAARKDKPQLVRRDERDYHPPGSGDDGGGDFYGAPMITASNTGGSWSNAQINTGPGVREPVAGYSQDYLDSLSDAEYAALVEGLREAGMLDPRQREAQIAALERASASRSGAATQD